jgi:hypothetical protein
MSGVFGHDVTVVARIIGCRHRLALGWRGLVGRLSGHRPLRPVERKHLVRGAPTTVDAKVPTLAEKLDGTANLAIADTLAVGVLDVVGEASVASPDPANVQEAVQVDDQPGDLSHQAK